MKSIITHSTIMTALTFLTFAGLAAAQYSNSVGGALPAGIDAPMTSGFSNPTVQPSRGGAAICVSGHVPVMASAENVMFNFSIPANESDVTDTFLKYITQGSTFAQSIMGGMHNVSGNYSIGATLCMPANGTIPSSVQLLTHGIGFDRYYWDFAAGYSYVDYAIEQGYATFSYDRLGVGLSSTPDPIQVVQGPLEVSIANQLATSLRNSKFGGANFSTVIGVGHSFGSAITQAVTSMHATTFDAAILTGFSMNQTAIPAFVTALNLQIASQNQPYRFAGLNNGYLVDYSAVSNQYGFFRAPNFDPLILAAGEAAKGSVTFGELFTQAAIASPAMNFTGPVAIVNGAADLPFCFGNCSYPMNLAEAAVNALYPASMAKDNYLAPSTGHGVNLHYTAMDAYKFIGSFLKQSRY
ncbi:alpha/beta-hydrolase [Aureobasidium pullulans]|uniref:Alpha/beta-hydrolase n=1 Tax=Aureobasidium pullulans TaxID=5580 RepID=A0A4S9S250_AURPU|nr:alpha/beta-hydrolase [Aureobasidium pullulans]